VLRQDYIRTAEAKGLRQRVVVLRHAVKNAMIPVVTHPGASGRVAAGGSVIVESVFGLPGIGLLILNAIGMRDYPIVQAPSSSQRCCLWPATCSSTCCTATSTRASATARRAEGAN